MGDYVFNFDIPFTMLIAGHTGSGKSTLLRKILKQIWTKFEYVFIMSKTLELNDDYKEFPENSDPDILPIVKHYGGDFEASTQKIVDEAEHEIVNDREDAPDILIVYEDQADTKLVRNKSFLDTFALLSRHYKVSMIFSTQKISGIGRTIRVNTKYFILFPQSNFTEMERFIEELVPSKYKRLIRAHIGDIFSAKYVYLILDTFNPILKDRMWLMGKINVVDYLEELERQQPTTTEAGTPAPKRYKKIL